MLTRARGKGKARGKITTGRLQRQNGRQFYNKRGKSILIYTTERF